jgi:opacity protein-like surface antigen
MKKLMVLAAMLAMTLAVAAPALAQQTSGPAGAGGASLTAGDLANQCVQVANNVNSGNVDQDAAAANIQSNIGALALLEQNATAGGGFFSFFNFALNLLGVEQNVTQTNNATQTNVIGQDGIDQINNAQLTCNQAIAQVK